MYVQCTKLENSILCWTRWSLMIFSLESGELGTEGSCAMLLGANRGSDTQDFINKQTPFLPSLKIVPSPPSSIHPKQTKTWSEQYLHTPRRIHSCGCLVIVTVTSEGASSSLCGVSQLLECRPGTTIWHWSPLWHQCQPHLSSSFRLELQTKARENFTFTCFV